MVCPLSDDHVSSYIMAHQQAAGLPSGIRAHSAPLPFTLYACERQACIYLILLYCDDVHAV